MTRERIRSAGSLLAAIAVMLVLLTPFCGVLHRCGCTALWSGGEERCNYRDATGPHCPWCEYRALAGAVTVAVVGGQALAFRALRKRGVRPELAGLGALAASPLAGLVAGALAWSVTDYPHFLVLDARSRLGLPRGPISTIAHGEPGKDCCSPEKR